MAIFYALYWFTTIRFILHTGVLAFPIPRLKLRKKQSHKLILIQYPIRNEPPEIIERFIRSLTTIPRSSRHRFLLQILDDSDKSIRPKISDVLTTCPIRFQYLKRLNRIGNKAGNLNYGLRRAPAKFQLVAVFDSDHEMDGRGLVEAANVLEANKRIVCVQSRWLFRQVNNSPLIRLQEQVLHTHIEREQTFRSVYDLYPIFNGAGALWKRNVIEKECDGWLERSVCEDTDISGVMNMLGYRIVTMPTWTTLTDNPENWAEYQKQQRRWIKSNGQHLQYHGRDKRGWSLKKLYWLSWNAGFLFAPIKYAFIPYAVLKVVFGGPIYTVDYVSMAAHVLALIASMQNWDNSIYWRGLINYPLHYITELRVLHHQIYGFWQGFLGYKQNFVFEVTKKEIRTL